MDGPGGKWDWDGCLAGVFAGVLVLTMEDGVRRGVKNSSTVLTSVLETEFELTESSRYVIFSTTFS